MQLVVITPDELLEDELVIVNNMFDNGLHALHIRKPKFTIHDYRDYIKAVKTKYHWRLVIHNHYELYREFWLDGIHLNAAARNDQLVWEQIKELNIRHSWISTSFHSWKEIEENDFHYRYAFISPVFDSISKRGYKAAIDLNGALETKQKLKSLHKYCPKIFGLGGVVPDQLKVLHEHGFDGAAMLGAIWDNEFSYVMFLDAMVQLQSI
jgi:thiamine-phosphate pyrophosphorylase